MRPDYKETALNIGFFDIQNPSEYDKYRKVIKLMDNLFSAKLKAEYEANMKVIEDKLDNETKIRDTYIEEAVKARHKFHANNAEIIKELKESGVLKEVLNEILESTL